MHRANSRAGQHGNRGLGNIRQINKDAVAPFDVVALQHIRETANFAMELLVRERAFFARFALPDDGRLVSPRTGQVTVETIFRDVEFAADEPLGERRFPFHHFLPSGTPKEFACFSRPELFRLSNGFSIHPAILNETFDARLAAEVPRWFENAFLDQMRFDVAVHEQSLICRRNCEGKCAVGRGCATHRDERRAVCVSKF